MSGANHDNAPESEPSELSRLKGILNTNDDPFSCALCGTSLGIITTSSLRNAPCCGKQLCDDCEERRLSALGSEGCCQVCNFRGDPLKKCKQMAKRGHAWAQDSMAAFYDTDTLHDAFEAVRFCRKAALQGHPLALLGLSMAYAEGRGCMQDLVEAERCARKAMRITTRCEWNAKRLLVSVARQHLKGIWYFKGIWRHNTNNALKIAMAIALPLAEEGLPCAQEIASQCLFFKDDDKGAKKWSVLAASQGYTGFRTGNVAYLAMLSCFSLDQAAQARYWCAIGKQLADNFESFPRVDSVQEYMRDIRHSCAECGKALEEQSERKMCKECKTYCFCSRECFKKNWNREDGSAHRSDCKELMELKLKMKDVVFEKED